MKIKFLLISFVLFNSLLIPQHFWEKLNGPPGGDIVSLYINGDTILAGRGSYKTIYIFYSSFDKGKSWKEHRAEIQNVPFIWNIWVRGFEISGNRFYLAATNGVYRSTELGNWEKINIPGNIRSLGHDNSGNLYAGTDDDGKIFQSSNSGESWQLVYTNPEGGEIRDFILKPDSILLVSAEHRLLLKRPGNPEWESIYFPDYGELRVMVDDYNNIYAYVGLTIFRSTDGGLSWVELQTQSFFWGNEMSDYIYNRHIIGGFLDMTGLFGNGWGAAVSDDRGATWRWSQQGLPKNISGSKIEKDGNDTYLATSGAGIFKSTDYGESWFAVNNGINAAEVRDICFDKEGIIYTASMKCGLAKSTDKGANWQVINNGLTNCFGTSIISDNISGTLIAGTWRGIFRSTDKGGNWVKIKNEDGYRLEKDKKGRIYAVSYTNGLFRTTDLGDSWVKLDQGITADYLNSVAEDSNGNIYAGGGLYGQIFKSTDDGLNWIKVHQTNGYGYVENIVVSPNGSIFASNMYEGILRSTDQAQSWTVVKEDRQYISFVYALAIDPKGTVYTRTSDAKIIRSRDNGDTWEDISDNNLLNVNKLIFHNKELYLGTDESVWKGNPDSLTGMEQNEIKPTGYYLSQNYPNPFNPTTTIKYSLAQAGRITLSIYDLLGREVVKLIDEEKPAGEYELTWKAENYPSGVYFCRMSAGNYSETRKLILMK